MSANVINLNDGNFAKTVLESSGVTLVDFWAPWCGPCVALAPTIDAIAQTYDGRVQVAKLDVDESPGLASQYGISSIPTMILFRDGTPVRQWTGIQSQDTYEAAILSVLRAA